MAKEDVFDKMLRKQFQDAPLKIAKPSDAPAALSYEERRRIELERRRASVEPAGEGSEGKDGAAVPAGVPARKAGRPRKSDRGEVTSLTFLINKPLKAKLERLKIDLYRSSVTDLLMEAIVDLLKKYDVDVSEG